jgi:hypothetical protein
MLLFIARDSFALGDIFLFVRLKEFRQRNKRLAYSICLSVIVSYSKVKVKLSLYLNN